METKELYRKILEDILQILGNEVISTTMDESNGVNAYGIQTDIGEIALYFHENQPNSNDITISAKVRDFSKNENRFTYKESEEKFVMDVLGALDMV